MILVTGATGTVGRNIGPPPRGMRCGVQGDGPQGYADPTRLSAPRSTGGLHGTGTVPYAAATADARRNEAPQHGRWHAPDLRALIAPRCRSAVPGWLSAEPCRSAPSCAGSTRSTGSRSAAGCASCVPMAVARPAAGRMAQSCAISATAAAAARRREAQDRAAERLWQRRVLQAIDEDD